MTSRRGLSGGQYKPLSDEDINKIHATSLRVFSEIGVQVNFPEALELFRKAGATIDQRPRTGLQPGHFAGWTLACFLLRA
jgi:trimethylamine--corrinoid protein Co-methyltransferase